MESQNRRRLNDGDRTYDPLVQKAARQPTVCLLRGGGTREEGGMERMRESKTKGKIKDRCKMKRRVYKGANNFMNINNRKELV